MTFDFAQPAVTLCIVAAGTFFLAGLLTGAWKYFHIDASPEGVAPAYVDIAHRAALLYSFAALLLAVFAALSAWPHAVNFVASLLPLVFFGAAIGSYVVHGLLRDTDNQLRRPHRLGSATVPDVLIKASMWLLMAAEIGGFVVLFAGALQQLA